MTSFLPVFSFLVVTAALMVAIPHPFLRKPPICEEEGAPSESLRQWLRMRVVSTALLAVTFFIASAYTSLWLLWLFLGIAITIVMLLTIIALFDFEKFASLAGKAFIATMERPKTIISTLTRVLILFLWVYDWAKYAGLTIR